MQNKRFGSLTSSVDFNKLSTTIQAVILGASSLIIFLASYFGHTLLPNQIEQFANNAAITISTFGVVIAVIGTVFGAIRKIIVSKFEVSD